MTDYIEVLGTINGTKEDGTPMQLDDADNVGNLLSRDATHGTFGEFTGDYWKDKLKAGIDKLAMVDNVRGPTAAGEFSFRLQIQSDLFNPSQGGIQHLIGILAGDLGTLQVRGLRLRPIKITDVSFPPAWKEAIQRLYRENCAHDIQEIRAAFNLKEDEPLLAFSLKPRMGLTSDGLREITLGVLKQGFHIVELDTRNLDLSDKTLEELLDLCKRAADLGKDKRITRLSINLSVPAHLALDVCNRFQQNKLPAPFVVKVDGGLDGISTCQAIRRSYSKLGGKSTPFITTYPLFRNVIRERVTDDTFLNALIWSGSDIIYPGNAPNLGGYRQLDHSSAGALTSSVDRYWRMVSAGYPMPTVAGGIYPGQLQAYYELLGPKVAYFIGGGVALHKEGPVKGAALCVKILEEARNLRAKAGSGFANEIKDDLKESAEQAIEIPSGADENTFRYFPVSELAGVPALKPWFKR